MKRFILPILLLLCIASGVFAQQSPPPHPRLLITVKGDTIKNTSNDYIFNKVEIESAFPGGSKAWVRYLKTHLKYPPEAIKKGMEGRITLQFIVWTDGTVYNMEVINGPKIFGDASLKALKHTPRWIPAVISGRKVKSYKRQPVIFKFAYY